MSAIVIDPMNHQGAARWRKEVANFCAQVVRDGDEIEKMDTVQVRVSLESCKCPKPPKPAKQEALAL